MRKHLFHHQMTTVIEKFRPCLRFQYSLAFQTKLTQQRDCTVRSGYINSV